MSQVCKSRWLIGGLLFVSLALNVFLAGWVTSGHPPHPLPHGPMMFWDSFNDKLKNLPDPARASVKKVLDTYRPQVKAQMNEVMKSRDAIDRMFARDDYNRADAEKRFADMQQKSAAMQQLMQKMMLDVADALPPEHRARFMERPKELRGKGDEFRNAMSNEVPAEAPRANEATQQ